MKKETIFTFLILFLLFTQIVHAQETQRHFEQAVVSSGFPKTKILVDGSLKFIGRVEFPVDTFARAEEFIFSDLEDGRLGKTLVIHFEYFFPSNDKSFIYPRFRMAKIGKHEYLHQIWYLKDFDLFTHGETAQMLKKENIQAGNEWLLNRYVRAVDTAEKHELIIFYLEPGNMVPDTIKSLPPGDPRDKSSAPWQKQLAVRANKLFRFISE
jgi:hypothetical protein